MAGRIRPNAAEKRWLQTVSEYGPVVPGAGPTQIHHIFGRTYRQNKVEIGHWAILPLPWQFHDVASNDPCNVTHYRHKFVGKFGTQRDLFDQMLKNMEFRGIIHGVPGDVIDAIKTTKY